MSGGGLGGGGVDGGIVVPVGGVDRRTLVSVLDIRLWSYAATGGWSAPTGILLMNRGLGGVFLSGVLLVG